MKRPALRSAIHTLSVSSALLLVLVSLDPHRTVVQSCGVTIHNEIAFRASRILLSGISISDSHSSSYPSHSQSYSPSQSHSKWSVPEGQRGNWSKGLYDYVPLLEQKESLFAGSFFPDWGYNCIGKLWNEAAEEAHWPPFAEAAVKYILETYPKPWTDHTKALIVFLFGTVSHSLGDMSWHALRGLDAGFIRALAYTSFDGDYSKGHTLADIGAEFVLSHMSEMDHLVTSWKVPVKDISAIYKRMGYYVPGPVLSHCMRNGYAGAQANARLGTQLFPVYASKSPFLIEQVENYPMGGLRDMAGWTIDCWNGLADYLDQGRKLPDNNNSSNSTATSFDMCYALSDERIKQERKDAMENIREGLVRHQHGLGTITEGPSAVTRLRLAGLRVLSEVDDDTGMVTFSMLGAELEEEQKLKYEDIKTETAKEVFQDELREQPDVKDGGPFTQLSHSTTQQPLTWKSRAREEETELHLQQLKSEEHAEGSGICLSFSDELESQARTLFLPIEYSSFGHAVATGDFDGDGNTDLVVAAPHATFDPLLPSQGSVFIVPGQSLFVDQGSFDGETGTDIRSIASRVLLGDPEEPQSRFGWSLAVVDLNQDGIDDLAIGAPGHGAKDLKYDGSVYVYFGHKGSGLSEKPDLVIRHDRTKDAKQKIPKGMDTLGGLGYILQGLDLTGSGYVDLVVGMPMATTRIDETTEKSPPNPSSDDTDGDRTNPQKRFKPQAGKILVFLAQTKHRGHRLDTDHDWELLGEDPFGWFGAAFTVVSQRVQQVMTSGTSGLSSLLSWIPLIQPKQYRSRAMKKSYERRILVVGSPAFGVGEQEAMRGKIQGFVIPDFSNSSPPFQAPQRVFTIHGDSKFQQLGSSLAMNRIPKPSAFQSSSQIKGEAPLELLVVGSQSEDILSRLPRIGRYWQAGMVRILDISVLSDASDVKISDLDADPKIVRDYLHGSQSMAHLSAAMKVSTDGKSLWLTEPYAKAEVGRILEWVPDLDGEGAGGDRVGGGSRRGGKKQRKDIVVLRGRRLVHGNRGDGGDDDDDDDSDQDRIKQCFIGSDSRGRFGSQLLVHDLNKDGFDDIVVTSSHASQYATMAGTITIKFRS
ncbi:hypothetical protein BC939DRAFT_444247 [Gamsiella multidivaricata]|uniref:uncharacterized protein n=1 Tax=Gamsiella multidivaricata TaxID=101098 RepID=UPI00221F09DA|nr:uncharacterized protein BC939DRAFT_444247 [Gamsiella multidivaricata]KAG0360889.1 integrin subunit alpha 8 [Gamsiella multidivaricata]KAI7827993.1 hypothetical protein BC939DRAFT_444247 [Gamsiella multidivaricata]